ncbi:unnamed protein product [Rotaria sp. Silwood1]|nr:unnamed protein product [Rotaria sp. Silwood1]
MGVFLHDLNQAYSTGQITIDDNSLRRYLDYAIIEQQMPMTAASMYWRDTLRGYNINHSLPLPFDRYRLSDERRTGRGVSFSFDFGEDISHDFLSYSLSNDITIEQLALASYYAFLFKLTNGESDLCIGMNTHGRYKEELMSVIGLFVNNIPLRCQLDPHWSFHQLAEHVKEIITSSLEYSYFPLQRILAQHPNATKPVFLETSFEFQSYTSTSGNNEITIGNARLIAPPFSIKIDEYEIMSKFDFVLTIQHDLDTDQLSCTINASLDLFDKITVDRMSQRFCSMLEQLLNINDNQMKKPIYELSLVLPDEKLLMKSMNNTQVLFPSFTCIHHEFVRQVMKHPQKVAVEMDDQSLTYSELLYYVQVLSLNLLNEQIVVVGEMMIGIIAIEMIGAVYCPLSPRDPQHRLHSLVSQTQCGLVLVHWLTKTKFNNDIILLDIDSVLLSNNIYHEINVRLLSSVVLTSENIAYIIFTSGSTGTPKAAQVQHRNFIQSIRALQHIDSMNKNDTVIQMARCSFDIHVQEIIGILIIGGTLVMLCPRGNIDFEYLSMITQMKQITFFYTVPTLLQSFFNFITETQKSFTMKYLRSVCTGGERCSVKLVKLLESNIDPNCHIWNLCGPAETTLQSIFHKVSLRVDKETIPLGTPLPNYHCLIQDDFAQPTMIGQEAEVLMAGEGIFAAYLGRQDLTAKVLLKINDEIYYRTGDLVRMDKSGLLHYQGRKDFQIKLHGQRIELGEIERCLLNTSITACVVIKWDDDHLIAYVQGSDIDEEQLRKHCQSHLPPHMVPSLFIVLDKLPLNANGKIDRKHLPPPSSLFSKSLPLDYSNNSEIKTALDEIESAVHTLWCDILQQNHISIDANIFTIGGHSLLLMQLYHRYQTTFHLETNSFSMRDLFQYPTIREHARFIFRTINTSKYLQGCWSSLHLIQGRQTKFFTLYS